MQFQVWLAKSAILENHIKFIPVHTHTNTHKAVVPVLCTGYATHLKHIRCPFAGPQGIITMHAHGPCSMYYTAVLVYSKLLAVYR